MVVVKGARSHRCRARANHYAGIRLREHANGKYVEIVFKQFPICSHHKGGLAVKDVVSAKNWPRFYTKAQEVGMLAKKRLTEVCFQEIKDLDV